MIQKGELVNPTEVFDFLAEIEGRFPVDQWVVGGIRFWPILRVHLAFQLDDFAVRQPPITSVKTITKQVASIANGLVQYVQARISDASHEASPNRRADAVILTQTACRFFSVEGRSYDIFSGSFNNILGKTGRTALLLEYAPKGEYRIPRYQDSIFIQPRLDYYKIRAFFKSFLRCTQEIPGFDDFIRFVNERVPGNAPTVRQIRLQISFMKNCAEYFKRQLLQSKATAGFVINYYCLLGMAFNMACREIGIPSVDIQHGIAGHHHPAYGRWNRIPAQGFEMLPTYFWCWSEAEAEAIRAWNKSCFQLHQPLVGGNLAIHMFQQADNDLVRYFDQLMLSSKMLTGKATNILVTLQTGRGIQQILKEALLRSPESLTWWIRLHPSMDNAERETIRDILKQVNVRNYNLDEASELPLYSILRHTDVHVTESSAVTMDAANFGVRTVLINTTRTQYFSDYISSGLVVIAKSAGDLLNEVEGIVKRNGAATVFRVGDYTELRDGERALENIFGNAGSPRR